MAAEVMIRSYAGQNQMEATALYGKDAPALAAEGWVPATQVWVTDDWPQSAYIAAAVLIIVGIGIVLLILMFLFKPTRTLLVTYERSAEATSPST